MNRRLPISGRTVLSSQKRQWCRWCSLTLGLILAVGKAADGLAADEPTLTQLLSQARRAYKGGDLTQALSLANRAIKQDMQNPQGFFLRGWLHEMQGNHHQAISNYNVVVKLDPKAVEIYNRRGSEHFKLGHIEASIADFNRAIELEPKQEPYHWQRGISYYYAGLYQKGQAQFQSHQKVNSNDVENAVWHFLCNARLEGVSFARQALLNVKRDPRVPLMEIYQLFKGEGTVEEVMQAARGEENNLENRHRQLFYAHLYLGLYHEIMGDETKAREHIMLASERYSVNHYMGNVARLHADRLSQR